MTKVAFHFYIATAFMGVGYTAEEACAEARQALRECPTPEARAALIAEMRAEA